MRTGLILLLPALLLFTLALNGCGRPKTAPPPPGIAAEFKKAEQEHEAGHHQSAIENWQKVRDAFHSPELTTLAELRIADAYYESGQTIEAIAAYEDFLKQHPEHVHTSAVLLRLGKAHFSEMRGIDQDQSATRNALASFEQLKRQDPAYADSAELDSLIRQCRDRLAGQERYVADFYRKTKRYDAAIKRYRDLLNNYPETSERDQVRFGLAQAYAAAGQRDEALALLNALEQQANSTELRKQLRKFRSQQRI
ncbi:MAG: tetratricopeptide repeat protein [Chloroflexia bacterium]|nr:tetratricopeptide repeat protein [Chloroflexia bacterium]